MTCGLRAYSKVAQHRYGVVHVSRPNRRVHEQGVVLRVYQQVVNPERLYFEACSGDCLDFCGAEPCPGHCPVKGSWRPLGMTMLSMDDGGDGESGMRIGELRIAVPRDNPDLLRDREHLLALRDVLEGGAMDLDWSVSRPTTTWEGVTVSGSPPRVTGLNLSQRGLQGEVWGYIGDLTELTELRLDGNQLSGLLPTKMHLLSNLSSLYLAGNDFHGCIAPGLWAAQQHDLDSLNLLKCPIFPNAGISEDGHHLLILGPTDVNLDRDELHYLVLDVPQSGTNARSYRTPAHSCELDEGPGSVFESAKCGILLGVVLRDASDAKTWVFFRDRLDPEPAHILEEEAARSHYSGCVYDCDGAPSPAAWIEQLVASAWTTAPAEYNSETDTWIWIWP